MNDKDWDIKHRAETCAVSGRPFGEGEVFYTLLFRDADGFRRQDLSEEAWRNRAPDADPPFSFWRSKFEPAPPPAPEPLPKETAEDLLRRFMQEGDDRHASARYLLAVMLERKRMLKQTDEKRTETGRTLVYEHVRTGEVFIVPDPQLRLDQIEQVQRELAELLGGRT